MKTYTSPIQKSTANANGYLGFKWMSVDVRPPRWASADNFREFAYRLLIKVYRYAADGSVRSIQRTPAYDFRIWIDGEHAYNQSEFCWGRMRHLPEE